MTITAPANGSGYIRRLVQRESKWIVIARALGFRRAKGVAIHCRAIDTGDIHRGADRFGKHASPGGVRLYSYFLGRQTGECMRIQPGDRLFERSAIREAPQPNVAARSLPPLFLLA